MISERATLPLPGLLEGGHHGGDGAEERGRGESVEQELPVHPARRGQRGGRGRVEEGLGHVDGVHPEAEGARGVRAKSVPERRSFLCSVTVGYCDTTCSLILF